LEPVNAYESLTLFMVFCGDKVDSAEGVRNRTQGTSSSAAALG
jgi:hypothetical protein